MNTHKCFSPNVRSLPLVNAVAHPFLESSLSLGLNTKNSHLALLDSFLEDPQQHRNAVRSPEVCSGPFDGDGDVADIRHFRDGTLERCAVRLRYAPAIEKFFRLLPSSGLSGPYAKVDELIRHGVERSYDVCEQPVARFIEQLSSMSARWGWCRLWVGSRWPLALARKIGSRKIQERGVP